MTKINQIEIQIRAKKGESVYFKEFKFNADLEQYRMELNNELLKLLPNTEIEILFNKLDDIKIK